MTAGAPVRIRILHVADCASLDRVRALVDEVIAATRCTATVEEVEGDYSSPTVLVNGTDATGRTDLEHETSCRLDLPTADQLTVALAAAARDMETPR